jgi:outer membrane protease
MATRIIEYGNLVGGSAAAVPAAQKVVSQAAITATTTPTQSSAFNVGTGIVLVQSDEAVYVAFGSNPTATTNDYRIQAAGEQFFWVGSGNKVSVRT